MGDQPIVATLAVAQWRATPPISPDGPVGEIYRYRVVGPPGYSLTDLKTIEDWILERRFKAVPGVIDVTGWGGKSKTYDITVDLDRLQTYGLTLAQVLQVVVGGQTVTMGPQSAIVRGLGLLQSMDQIRATMITATNGVPVRIRDIATVSVGHLPRLGIAGKDDDDIAQGIVLMRRDQQSEPTIRAVKAEVAKINASDILPPGVRVESIYDRSDLISVTTSTVLHNMVYGMVLIFFVQWLFPRQFAQRRGRRSDDPVCPILRDRDAGLARRIGEPLIGRCDRFRPRRRCNGADGRKHLSPSRRGRLSTD
jgi:cobalt-zinc-cadmium resistance protein CzcA